MAVEVASVASEYNTIACDSGGWNFEDGITVDSCHDLTADAQNTITPATIHFEEARGSG